MSSGPEDGFWEVQRIWARTKVSPIGLGQTENRGATTDACSPTSASSAEDLGRKLLKLLAQRGSVDSYELSQELGVDHQQVVGAVKSLQSLGEVRTRLYLVYIYMIL